MIQLFLAALFIFIINGGLAYFIAKRFIKIPDTYRYKNIARPLVPILIFLALLFLTTYLIAENLTFQR